MNAGKIIYEQDDLHSLAEESLSQTYETLNRPKWMWTADQIIWFWKNWMRIVRVHTEISNFGGEPPLLSHTWEIWGRFPLKRHFRWSRLERKSPFALHSVSSQSKRNNCYIKYMAFYMAFYIFHWYIKIIFYLLFIII